MTDKKKPIMNVVNLETANAKDKDKDKDKENALDAIKKAIEFGADKMVIYCENTKEETFEIYSANTSVKDLAYASVVLNEMAISCHPIIYGEDE